jgi:hypothetical protein
MEVYLYFSYMPSGCGEGLYFSLYQASYSKWLINSHSSVPLLSKHFTDMNHKPLAMQILKLRE